MAESIPLNTVLGERYKVTVSVIETADGDAVLEGKDQVLNRKVSIVVAAPVHNQRLITNARSLATASRSSIQILDLGNTDDRTYLITSHTRADALLDRLLTDSSTLKANSDKEALGQEIFGADRATTSSVAYQKVRQTESETPAAISATRDLDDEPAAAATAAAPVAATATTYEPETEYEPEPEEEYDDYEYEDEDDRKGSPWVLALAAVILLMIGAAAVYSSLNGMINKDSVEAGNQASATASATAAPSKADAKKAASPKASATKAAAKVTPKFTGVSRIVESNSTFMADQDGILKQMIDGNTGTQWMTYGFGSANFGGLVDSFALSYELEKATKVSTLTINQVSGTGGAFTVYTNSKNSMDGAVQVGTGSFTDAKVDVKLDTDKQSDDTKYVIVKFTEAPTLSQPIVNGFVYGARISEVSASN